jgi:hypothetical protein
LLQARNRDPPKEEQQQKPDSRVIATITACSSSSGTKQREQSQKYTEGQTWRERTRGVKEEAVRKRE